MNKLSDRLKWGIDGGFLGGLIAIIGFWILSPPTDSAILFVILRIIIGSIVAIIIGPIVATRLVKNKSKEKGSNMVPFCQNVELKTPQIHKLSRKYLEKR